MPCAAPSARTVADQTRGKGNGPTFSDRQARQGEATDLPGRDAVLVNVIGCLTSDGDAFVLTELEPATGSTEAFLIVNKPEDLREHAGKEVRIAGTAEPARLTDVVEIDPRWTPPTPVGTSGRDSESRVSVGTGSHVKLKMRRTWVASVSPLGESALCAR